MPPHPRRAPSREAAAADAAVDSPAAALAASMSTARLRRTPLQFTLRLQHPAAADDGNSDAAVPGVQASSPAAASSAGSSSSAGGKTAATAAAAGSAEAAGPAEPEAESSSSPGNGSSSSSSSSRSSNKPSAAPPRRSSATRAGRRSQGVARGAGGVRQQQEPRWLPLVMVAGLPHVELELVSASGRRHSGLFMLDSGEEEGRQQRACACVCLWGLQGCSSCTGWVGVEWCGGTREWPCSTAVQQRMAVPIPSS